MESEVGKWRSTEARKDPELCNGDNRSNFLQNPSEFYVLYFWHRLDQEGKITFTLSQLLESMAASADKCASVLELTKRTRSSRDNSVAESLSGVATGISQNTMANNGRLVAALVDKLEVLEDELSDLEDDEASQKKRRRIMKKIARTEEMIKFHRGCMEKG